MSKPPLRTNILTLTLLFALTAGLFAYFNRAEPALFAIFALIFFYFAYATYRSIFPR